MTAALKDMILHALDQAGGPEGGVAYLAAQAKENPAAFLTLLGKVLPMQLTGESGGALAIHVVDYGVHTGVERDRDSLIGGNRDRT